jgi:hypothetical protein
MVPKWELVTLKREGNIRRWEAEVIAPTRPADSNNKARRKSQANADAAASALKAPV